MLKLTHIRETELAKLRQLRDEIDAYNWKFYTRRTHTQQRRGTGAR